MADDVMQRVIRVIADTQRIPADSIKPDSTFQELKIDSLDGINIIFAVENEFNVNVPDDTVKTIRSVRDVAEGVEKLLASA
jgi:acyl carrier protein